jgi:hypothetical protein
LGLFYVSRRTPVYPSIVPLIGGHQFGGLETPSFVLVFVMNMVRWWPFIIFIAYFGLRTLQMTWYTYSLKRLGCQLFLKEKKEHTFGLRTLHWQMTWHRPMSSTRSIIRVQSNKTKKKLIT